MTKREALLLTREVHAACPQQAIDEYTPDMWFDLLSDLIYADAKAAAIAVAKRRPWVSPAEIRAGVTEIRQARLRDTADPVPPPELVDNPPAYLAALNAGRLAIADGRNPEPAMRAVARQRRLELEQS